MTFAPNTDPADQPSAIRLLHVEDNPADIGLVAALLEDSPDPAFHCQTANNLASAKNLITAPSDDAFDVILLDLGLPDSQGLESLKGLLQVSEDIPIVVLTGNDDIKLGREAVAAGAEDYLEKNQAVTGNLLIRTLEYAVQRAQRAQRAQNPPEAGLAAPADTQQSVTDGSPANPAPLSQREPAAFDALLEGYSSLLASTTSGGGEAVANQAATEIIEQLATVHAEPTDLIEIHSRATRRFLRNDDSGNATWSARARQLLLTMMSRLTSHYLVT